MKVIDKVPPTVAIDLANQFISYFGRFETIEDYIRVTKEAAVQQAGRSIFSIKDKFFNGDIHPEEMEFDIKFVGDRFTNNSTNVISQQTYHDYLTATSSAIIEKKYSW